MGERSEPAAGGRIDRGEIDDAPIDSSRIHARVTIDTVPGGGWGETQVLLHDREIVVLTRTSALDAFRRLPMAAGSLPTLVDGADDGTLRLPVVGGDVDVEVPLRSRDDVRRFLGRIGEIREWTERPDEPAPTSTPPSTPLPAPHAPPAPTPVVPSAAVVEARSVLLGALEERRAALEADEPAPSQPARKKKRKRSALASPQPAATPRRAVEGPRPVAQNAASRPIGWADRLVWIATALALIAAAWVLLSKR